MKYLNSFLSYLTYLNISKIKKSDNLIIFKNSKLFVVIVFNHPDPFLRNSIILNPVEIDDQTLWFKALYSGNIPQTNEELLMLQKITYNMLYSQADWSGLSLKFSNSYKNKNLKKVKNA